MRRCGLGACIAIGACLALPLSAAAHPTQYGPAHTSLTASTSPALFTRGVYGKDASVSGYREMAATGFNTVMTGPYPELLGNVAAEGMKAVVWLGNFINAPRCAFEKDDNTVTGLLKVIAGNQVIAAYYLGDEPHVTECPQAPALFKQRTALLHALDPGSQTFTVIQASENGVSHDYAPWGGAVDIIGFDVYPCVRSSSMCNFNAIDAAIAAIKAAGIRRYWAIVQDFQDCYYRLPTPAEMAAQFDRWATSNMAGYFVFSGTISRRTRLAPARPWTAGRTTSARSRPRTDACSAATRPPASTRPRTARRRTRRCLPSCWPSRHCWVSSAWSRFARALVRTAADRAQVATLLRTGAVTNDSYRPPMPRALSQNGLNLPMGIGARCH